MTKLLLKSLYNKVSRIAKNFGNKKFINKKNEIVKEIFFINIFITYNIIE